MTRYALLDHLLQDRRKNWSIQDMTDYLAEHLPEYGSEPVTRRMVEKDLQYLEYDSPFEVEFIGNHVFVMQTQPSQSSIRH